MGSTCSSCAACAGVGANPRRGGPPFTPGVLRCARKAPLLLLLLLLVVPLPALPLLPALARSEPLLLLLVCSSSLSFCASAAANTRTSGAARRQPERAQWGNRAAATSRTYKEEPNSTAYDTHHHVPENAC
jgi:hypothetical protein